METDTQDQFKTAHDALMTYLEDRSDVPVKVGCFVRTRAGITPTVVLGHVQRVDEAIKRSTAEVLWFRSMATRDENMVFSQRKEFDVNDLIVINEDGSRRSP